MMYYDGFDNLLDDIRIDVNRYDSFMREVHRLAFILGYDLMHDRLINSDDPACDTVYEKCLKLAEQFMESDEYKDLDYSEYEAFENWLHRVNKPVYVNQLDTMAIADIQSRLMAFGTYSNSEINEMMNEKIADLIPLIDDEELARFGDSISWAGDGEQYDNLYDAFHEAQLQRRKEFGYEL